MKVSASMDLTENNFEIPIFKVGDEISRLPLREKKFYFHEQSRSDSLLSEIFLLFVNLLVLEC